jgi:membrane protein DedA with SNARE-associated domain
MHNIFVFLKEYLEYFPVFAVICLPLAGLNFPIPEDLIIITGALVSLEDPSNLPQNLIAIFFGVLVSDFIVYWIGTKARKGASKTTFFTRIMSKKALEKMHGHLDKYGIFTFIVGRFIPFGVRNTLFFSSGFFGLKLRDFIINDIVAALISVNTLFFLTYNFGEDIKKPIKIAGIILFIAFLSATVSVIIRLIYIWRREKILNKSPKAEDKNNN